MRLTEVPRERCIGTIYFSLVVQPMTEVILKVQPMTNRQLTSVDPFQTKKEDIRYHQSRETIILLSQTNKICPQTLRRRMKMKMKYGLKSVN